MVRPKKAPYTVIRLRKAQYTVIRLRKAPEMNMKHRYKQCTLTYSYDNKINCNIVVHIIISS